MIWTTTPWTIPASRAVSIHPDLNYALVQIADAKLVLAEELVDDCMQRYGITEYQVLATTTGTHLKQLELKHPYLDLSVPVICGEHVTIESGTGCVHTAPAHGVDDFNVGKEYGIDVYNPVGGNGVYLEDTPLFAGQHVFKANKPIVEHLESVGALQYQANYEHSYPHCWRHKTPIIFRATPQWFISMDENGLRNASLDEIKQTQWIPEWGEQRISTMVEGRPDWCISRQRTWGVPIALYIHKQTGDIHPQSSKLIEKVAQAVEQKGIQAWWDLDDTALLGAEVTNTKKSRIP